MKRRIVGLLLVVFMLLPLSVLAENAVINGNEFDVYKRSKEDIYNEWKNGKLEIPSNYNDIYDVIPSYESPYRAGVVKQSYLDDVLDNLNYYRYLVGVPMIVTQPLNDNELQTAEVVQTAYVKANGGITHTLATDWTKPSDMDDDFWTLGANANHNIISYNLEREPNYAFFDESIFDEDYPEAGHRVALLVPSLNRIEYGIGTKAIYARNTVNTNQYNNMNNSFAAYPSPGFFPKEDFASDSDWDIYLNINDFHYIGEDYQKDVVVTIKNLETNEIETRTLDDGNLNFDFECEDNWCTAYNILHIKQPSKTKSYYDGSYEVTVKNLIKKISANEGEEVDLTYTVNFYDKYEVSEANITDVNFDLYMKGVFYDGEYDSDLMNEAIEDLNLNLELDSGYNYNVDVNNYEIFFDRRYSDYDSYQAYPVFGTLPNWIKDPNNMMNGSKYLPILGAYDEYYYKFKYNSTDYTSYVGEDVTLSVDGLDTGLDVLEGVLEDGAVFIWIKEKDGVFTPLENIEGEEEKYVLSENGLNLTIKNPTKDDEGNYYVTALTYYEDYYDKYYFISKPLSLTVNKKVESINFDDNILNIVVGEVKKLEPVINPSDALYTLSWNSSDNNILTIDNDGNITGVNSGSVVVTVTTNNGLSDTININVNDFIKGDMNKNNKIDLKDIIILIKKYLGTDASSELDVSIGDMNNNNNLDLKDIILLIKTYLGVN